MSSGNLRPYISRKAADGRAKDIHKPFVDVMVARVYTPCIKSSLLLLKNFISLSEKPVSPFCPVSQESNVVFYHCASSK